MKERLVFRPWLFGAAALFLFIIFGIKGKMTVFFHWWDLCFLGISLLCWITALILLMKHQQSRGRRKVWCAVILACMLAQAVVVGLQMHSGALGALLHRENIDAAVPRIRIELEDQAPYDLEEAAAQALWEQLAQVRGRNFGSVKIPAEETLSWLSVYTADSGNSVLRITPNYGSGTYFVKIGGQQYQLTLDTDLMTLLPQDIPGYGK